MKLHGWSVVILLFAAASCTFHADLNPKITQSATGQMPLVIGVYYSPELLAYQQDEVLTGGSRMRFAVGEATPPLFNGVFQRLFREVRSVDRVPPVAADVPLDAVIEPRIERFTVDAPIMPTVGTWTARVTYLFTLYSPKGDLIASWTRSWSGSSNDGFTLAPGGSSLASQAVERAMEGLASNFVAEFKQIPELRRWLSERGIR
jgi:hypothetical protein